LSAIAFASKAAWGYEDSFMEACRAELTVLPEHLTRQRIRVATGDDGTVLGFHGLEGNDLEWMFVAPGAMGTGVGAGLWADACAIVRRQGHTALRVEADPFAAPFYERMGATPDGYAPSLSIPGRVLPVFTIDLTSTP
jgi:GNAT superfamily N-acetyltransferase